MFGELIWMALLAGLIAFQLDRRWLETTQDSVHKAMIDCTSPNGILPQEVGTSIVCRLLLKAAQAIGVHLLPIVIFTNALVTEAFGRVDIPNRILRPQAVIHQTFETARDRFEQYFRVVLVLHQVITIAGLSPTMGFGVLGLLHVICITVVWECFRLVYEVLSTIFTVLITFIQLLAFITD